MATVCRMWFICLFACFLCVWCVCLCVYICVYMEDLKLSLGIKFYICSAGTAGYSLRGSGQLEIETRRETETETKR